MYIHIYIYIYIYMYTYTYIYIYILFLFVRPGRLQASPASLASARDTITKIVITHDIVEVVIICI